MVDGRVSHVLLTLEDVLLARVAVTAKRTIKMFRSILFSFRQLRAGMLEYCRWRTCEVVLITAHHSITAVSYLTSLRAAIAFTSHQKRSKEPPAGAKGSFRVAPRQMVRSAAGGQFLHILFTMIYGGGLGGIRIPLSLFLFAFFFRCWSWRATCAHEWLDVIETYGQGLSPIFRGGCRPFAAIRSRNEDGRANTMSSSYHHPTGGYTSTSSILLLMLLLSSFSRLGIRADECSLTPVIHVLQYPGCMPKPIPSFACTGKCTSYVQVNNKILLIPRGKAVCNNQSDGPFCSVCLPPIRSLLAGGKSRRDCGDGLVCRGLFDWSDGRTVAHGVHTSSSCRPNECPVTLQTRGATICGLVIAEKFPSLFLFRLMFVVARWNPIGISAAQSPGR